ncbi:hypothetical protein KXD40_008318 [Peronospora effusa]|uniref:Uncharacterized protein n=1 Tax=Peronospora effusa TaxID=542832 RepID=A0A3M6VNA6_9STRA|nr:hypothetical protein DD238_007145 [Peronospora effusa]RQM18678.1 hypothetical protein DD237_007815 [Peronospora effusa]UIZ23965.1 hypothetical protein KXD40_008318 [Peronospora effusa]
MRLELGAFDYRVKELSGTAYASPAGAGGILSHGDDDDIKSNRNALVVFICILSYLQRDYVSK